MIDIYYYTILFFILFLSFINRRNYILDNIQVRHKNPINGLRAILASVVMYSHVYKELYIYEGKHWLYTQNEYFEYYGWGNQALNAGKIGVAIFFMISGYLFYSLLNREKLNKLEFLKQRAKRIFPLYFFVITFCFLFNIYSLPNLDVKVSLLEYIKWLLFFGDDSILEFMGMTSGVEWTLKLEILMYLTIPILFYIFHNFQNKVLKHFAIVLSILCLFLLGYILRTYLNFYIDPRAVLCFYIGYITLEIKNEKIIDFIKSNYFAVISVLFFISAFFITANNFYYLYLIFSCSFVFIAASKGNDIFGFLMNEQIQKLGEISYSIYLTHGVVLFFLLRYASYFLEYSFIGYFGFIFFQFLITFTISKLTFIYIEQWFNRPHIRGLLFSKLRQL
ncbi:acyltransferase [Acinetobacter baumannii]|uniref:acyltransferase family protein n=1 Tax=Acinetobacter baumannii TaxID=470 RepID=UPI00244B2B5F|nr:acyltransferase [Acinetobacter baumannii]MDH2600848.1 acyltransferase [Acinetobacter baumannii]